MPAPDPPAGPRRAQRIAFAVTALALGTLSAAVAAAGAAPQHIYQTDVFIPLDGAWRIACGQRPHADFYCPLGPLWLLPTAVFLDRANPSADALAYASAFWIAALGLWAWRAARDRLPPAGAAVLAISTGLLAGAAHGLGGAWFDSTYAMSYNRVGFALLTILLTLLFLPRRDGRAEGVAEGAQAGLALGALLLCKLNFFGVGIAALAPAALAFRRPARWWAGAAGGLAAVVAAFAVWLRFDLAAFAADMALVAAAQDWAERREVMLDALRNNAVPAGLAAVAALTALRGPGGFRERVARVAACLYIAAAGLLLCGTNYQVGDIPILPMAALAAVLSAGPEADRPPRGWARLPAAAAPAIVIALWLPITVPDALGIARATVWNFTHAADLPEVMRLREPPVRALVFLPNESLWALNRLSFLRTRENVNDGAALLRRHLRPGDHVGTVSFADPFGYSLALPPPAGGGLWWHEGKTFTAAAHPPFERAFGGCTLLMVPRAPGDGPHVARDDLYAVYGDRLRAEYAEIDATDRWHLLRRVR